MSSQNEPTNDDSASGFAGLATLLSNEEEIDITPRARELRLDHLQSAETSKASTESTSALPRPAPGAGKRPNRAPSAPVRKTSLSSVLWLVGIAALVITGVITSSHSGQSQSSSADQGQFDAAAKAVSESATQNPLPQLESAQGAQVLGVMPPVGANLVLDESQIRYCVAERIRIEGAKELAAMRSESEYDRFNTLVNDYNSRCSAFRYRRGDLEHAAAAVEPYRASLRVEGMRRVSDVQQEAPPEAQPAAADTEGSQPVPQSQEFFAPDGQAQASSSVSCTGVGREYELCLTRMAQQRANAASAGEHGLITREQLSQPEKDSLEASCTTDKYANGPAAYEACLKRRLAQMPVGSHRPDLSGLGQEELDSIEGACNTDKYANGPAAYNKCLQRNLDALSRSVRRPDLSGLNQAELDSIEGACNTDKYANGPAAYNKCLGRNLDALSKVTKRPDISRLNQSERDAIESACTTDKFANGPAAYNKCLVRQLRQLKLDV